MKTIRYKTFAIGLIGIILCIIIAVIFYRPKKTVEHFSVDDTVVVAERPAH